MKPTTTPSLLTLLLLASTPLSLAAPAQENQIVLGHIHTSARPTATPFTTVPTITTTRPRATATPTPLWKMTKSRTPSPTPTPTPTPVAKAIWDWLFHPQPPNRVVRPKGEGCFCAGGSTCCYRPDEEIVCGLGVC